ncbi:hypothetical protein G6F31_018183 [Rhizopus arrhizus]|nr:hypothetical protein G6F31_018183 [Rhizopus arrhizus]
MGHGRQAFRAGAVDHPVEQTRREALFAAVQADRDEGVAKGQGLVKGAHGLLFGQVAQKTQDQAAGHAQLLAAVIQRLADAVDHNGEWHAAVGMGLRVEEGFGVHHVLLAALQQISPGQVVEVLLGAQHL